MSDYEIKITIGPQIGVLRRTLHLVITAASILAIPAINVIFLDGNWMITVIGALFGLLVLVGTAKSMMKGYEGKSKSFTNTELAADWVRGWKPTVIDKEAE